MGIMMFTNAKWIGVPLSEIIKWNILQGDMNNRFAFFHLDIDLEEVGKLFLQITAVARYRLWINGKPVLSGPCKGDRYRQYYDGVDVSDYLKKMFELWRVLPEKIPVLQNWKAMEVFYMSEKPILGILLGNSAGVGPELVAMLAVKDYYADYCRPVIIGDLRMFEHGLKVVGGDVPHYVIDDLSQCDWSKGYPVLDLKDQDPDQVVYGEANAYCGAGDLKQLDTAIELCKAGKIEGIVFGPLHKGAMKMAGMHYESEHTYFAHAFDLKTPFCEVNMMDDLMTVRTTSHVPISEVSGMITESNLREAIELGEITGESLGHKPRIAVAALNPHCGEFGLCGREEVDVIQPTIEKVVKETGWNVTGPYSADTLFISALKGDFDVVVTMYHDQGQIALKLVGFQRCITVAGGQPYPIATCAHGTAFDKVGKASVTTDSFERAVRTTAQMALAKRAKANG